MKEDTIEENPDVEQQVEEEPENEIGFDDSEVVSLKTEEQNAVAEPRSPQADGDGAETDEQSSKSFPQKLLDILSDDTHSDIISWCVHGNGFIIHKKKVFAAEVLPKYFKASKFTSFTRKLNRWGFNRVPRGPETGAYFHKLFRRDKPELVLQMNSNSGNKYQSPLPGQLLPNAPGMMGPPGMPHGMPFPYMPGMPPPVMMGNLSPQQQQMMWHQQMQHMMHMQHMHMMHLQQMQQQGAHIRPMQSMPVMMMQGGNTDGSTNGPKDEEQPASESTAAADESSAAAAPDSPDHPEETGV